LRDCNKYKSWIEEKLQDKYFVDKMMITASFQRSGRQSEGSSEILGSKYFEYEQNDVNNAYNYMIKCDIFDEYNLYSGSIPWTSPWTSNNNISKIIHAAHLFDLRRMIGFDINRIKKQISEMLCPCIFHKIWNRTGIYLYVTGDRDLVLRKKYYSEIFFTKDINIIYSRLFKALTI